MTVVVLLSFPCGNLFLSDWSSTKKDILTPSEKGTVRWSDPEMEDAYPTMCRLETDRQTSHDR